VTGRMEALCSSCGGFCLTVLPPTGYLALAAQSGGRAPRAAGQAKEIVVARLAVSRTQL